MYHCRVKFNLNQESEFDDWMVAYVKLFECPSYTFFFFWCCKELSLWYTQLSLYKHKVQGFLLAFWHSCFCIVKSILPLNAWWILVIGWLIYQSCMLLDRWIANFVWPWSFYLRNLTEYNFVYYQSHIIIIKFGIMATVIPMTSVQGCRWDR